jgi:hypothetical protein
MSNLHFESCHHLRVLQCGHLHVDAQWRSVSVVSSLEISKKKLEHEFGGVVDKSGKENNIYFSNVLVLQIQIGVLRSLSISLIFLSIL